MAQSSLNRWSYRSAIHDRIKNQLSMWSECSNPTPPKWSPSFKVDPSKVKSIIYCQPTSKVEDRHHQDHWKNCQPTSLSEIWRPGVHAHSSVEDWDLVPGKNIPFLLKFRQSALYIIKKVEHFSIVIDGKLYFNQTSQFLIFATSNHPLIEERAKRTKRAKFFFIS